MAKYTTELRTVCEEYAGLNKSQGYAAVGEIIEKARPKVFDFDYPIFDPEYRNVLEPKILKHFYTRELALETVGLWKLRLDAKMNEIMPFYNQLYKSQLLDFNPLYDVDLTRTSNRQIDGTGTNTTDATGTGSVVADASQTVEGNTSDVTDANTILHEVETGSGKTDKNGSVHDNEKWTENTTKDLQTTSSGDGTTTSTGGEAHTGTETTTTDGTLKRTGTDTTTTDMSVDTNTSSNGGGSSSGKATSTQSGTDTTTDSGTVTTDGTTSETSLEERDLRTKTETTTGSSTRFSDTPQNNIQLALNENYLTTFTGVNGTEDRDERQTGTVDKSGNGTSKSTVDTEMEKRTKYGKVTTDDSTASYTENGTTEGTQKTTGTAEQEKNLTDTTHEAKVKENDLHVSKDGKVIETKTGSGTETGTVSMDGTRDKWNVYNENANQSNTADTNRTETGQTISEGSTKTDTSSQSNESRTTHNVSAANSKTQSIDQYIETVKGRNGGRTAASLILEFRSTFLNIDQMILEDLNELFFTLW